MGNQASLMNNYCEYGYFHHPLSLRWADDNIYNLDMSSIPSLISKRGHQLCLRREDNRYSTILLDMSRASLVCSQIWEDDIYPTVFLELSSISCWLSKRGHQLWLRREDDMYPTIFLDMSSISSLLSKHGRTIFILQSPLTCQKPPRCPQSVGGLHQPLERGWKSGEETFSKVPKLPLLLLLPQLPTRFFAPSSISRTHTGGTLNRPQVQGAFKCFQEDGKVDEGNVFREGKPPHVPIYTA